MPVDSMAIDRAAFTLEAAYRLHPRVAVRPERFGALLYHFGTRRLSFLKDPTLLQVVSSLADHDSARAACETAGADAARFAPALAQLLATDMLVAA